MSLRSTIHEISTRDNELQAIASNREQFLDAWKSDVRSLYQKIQSLLEDLTEEGSISFMESQKKAKENELGEYAISELKIKIASKIIIASPVARLVSGGTGRVDLYRSDRPTERDRVSLLRSVGERLKTFWSIETKSAEDAAPLNRFAYSTALAAFSLSGQARRVYRPLEKDVLEDSLDFLLKI